MDLLLQYFLLLPIFDWPAVSFQKSVLFLEITGSTGDHDGDFCRLFYGDVMPGCP